MSNNTSYKPLVYGQNSIFNPQIARNKYNSAYLPTQPDTNANPKPVSDAKNSDKLDKSSQIENKNRIVPMSDYDRKESIIANLMVTDAKKAIDFYKTVLGAKENFRLTHKDRIVHAELAIGNSNIMLSDFISSDPNYFRKCSQNVSLYAYVGSEDKLKEIVQLAEKNGAKTINKPVHQHYGDNVVTIKDPFNIIWHIASHIGDGFQNTDRNTVVPVLKVGDIDKAIDYYKNILGAEEKALLKHLGKISYVELAIRNTTFVLCQKEKTDSVEGCNPLVSLYMYVPNFDAMIDHVFNAAVKSGAKITYPLQYEYYGDRMGTIVDPFGITWSIATHIRDVPIEEIQDKMPELMAKMAQRGGEESDRQSDEFYRKKYLKYKQKYDQLRSKSGF